MRDLVWLKNQIPGLAGMKFHMPGLAGRLAIATGLLVALAVGSMYVSGVNALRDLAGAEAFTRVELAVAAAREGIRQSTDEALTAARILGERPTLQRLLRESTREAVLTTLSRNCEGAGVDGCAIVQNGEIVTATMNDLDWQRVLDAATEQGERFLVTGATAATAVGGAIAPVVDSDGFSVVTLRRLDGAFAERLSRRAGLAIDIIDYDSFQHGEGPLAVVHSDALLRDEPIAAYVEELDAYVSSLAVAAATGETVALLQATLPAEDIAAPVDAVAWRMLLWAVAIAALAAAGAVFLGRYWISPIERLTEAAQRLGSGDLTTSFRAGGGKELSTLGNTMEQMRRNLVELTGELRRREAEAQVVLGGIIEGVYAVDAQRRIRFLNPQAERLLKVDAANAIGVFCGDVLKPQRDRDGRRPCEHACPILEARREGAARAIERIMPVADDER
ncbi:MAG TPA: HAMP domain-containing protein, partial [Gammaproteobacteria bacterium]|nr:HAMP domain-containing protein [Gammaproteobacteria bacterium]